MIRNVLILMAVLAVLSSATIASAQNVSVTVIQVRASNQGAKFTDPALGTLGKRLERTYPFKSYKLVGSQTQAGRIGGTLKFALQGGMAMSLGLTSYAAPMVSMRVIVKTARAKVMNATLRARSGRPLIIGFPWGADRLIIIITPRVLR